MNSAKKYALVTGASSGIGFQYARVMAQRGYNLVIVSNQADAIVEKAEELRQEFSVDVVPLMRDLGTPEAARELYETCQAQNLEVEVLINNAGVYHSCDFMEEPERYNTLILNLHVNTPAMLIYYFGKDMEARKRGYILNMSSITSHIAVQRLAAYSATKAFLKNFSRSLHVELRYKGINVTAVCPGAVATDLYNISPTLKRLGVIFGIVITPERLAKRGVRAMFNGRVSITPGLINYILLFLIFFLPTGVLRLIRKWKLF